MKTEHDAPREFTDDELRAVLSRASENARQQAFAAGLSVMYAESGRLLLMHPDGSIEDAGALNDKLPTSPQ